MVINGRCETSGMSQRVRGVCPGCGTAITERAPSQLGVPRLQRVFPDGVDVCRAREDEAGTFVSDRFRDFALQRVPGIESTVQFVRVEWDAG
jgi:hypothetical protein